MGAAFGRIVTTLVEGVIRAHWSAAQSHQLLAVLVPTARRNTDVPGDANERYSRYHAVSSSTTLSAS
jgi:hypothetical protein